MSAASQLQRMLTAISAVNVTAIKSKKRAGVAAVLRVFSADSGRCIGGDTPAAVAHAAIQDHSAQLEMLFLKRALRKRDPWSGNVALPGGHRDPGDADDQAAAQRECWEEAGLDLGGDDFAFLGALDQRPIYTGGRKAKGFTMCPFVWLQLAPLSPPLTLQASEVAAAVWCPVDAISPQRRRFDAVTRDLQQHTLPVLKHVPPTLLESLGATSLHFPSVALPFSGATPQTRSSTPPSAASTAHLHLPTGSPFAQQQPKVLYSTVLRSGLHPAPSNSTPLMLHLGEGRPLRAHTATTTAAFNTASMSTWRSKQPPPPGDSQQEDAQTSDAPDSSAPNSAARAATAAALRHSKPHGAADVADFAAHSDDGGVSFGPEGQALADGTGRWNTTAAENTSEGSLPALEFQLWGLTLGVTSDLLALTHEAPQVPLNWPPVRFPGAVPSAIAWAVWGAMEVRDYPRYSLAPRHVAAACAALACAAGGLCCAGSALLAWL